MTRQVYFSAADVARVLGIHRGTVPAWVEQNRLPAPCIIAGVKRWHIADLRAAGIDIPEIEVA